MTHTHTNKNGARYRYYVSHALLQNRDSGSVSRVNAPELETTVVEAVRRHLNDRKSAEHAVLTDDRKLIEEFVGRAVIKPEQIEIHLIGKISGANARSCRAAL